MWLCCSSRVKNILLYIHTYIHSCHCFNCSDMKSGGQIYLNIFRISKCSIFSSTFLFFFTVKRVGRLGSRSRIGASDTWHATCVLLCDHVLWLSAVASTARCHARWRHSALLLFFLGSLKNNNWSSTFCSRLQPKLLAANLPLDQKKKKKIADSRTCKVQNERRRAISGLHHIWCVQTRKRLAEKKTDKQTTTLQLLVLVQGLFAPVWSMCLKVFFFSLHIHGIFLKHMWNQRACSSHRGSVVGRRSMKYVYHSCYCSVKAFGIIKQQNSTCQTNQHKWP